MQQFPVVIIIVSLKSKELWLPEANETIPACDEANNATEPKLTGSHCCQTYCKRPSRAAPRLQYLMSRRSARLRHSTPATRQTEISAVIFFLKQHQCAVFTKHHQIVPVRYPIGPSLVWGRKRRPGESPPASHLWWSEQWAQSTGR